jgi:RimJ/RimL family protein N-acetyltransferase
LPITSEELVLELNASGRFLFVVRDKKNNKIGAVRAFNLSATAKRGSIAFTMQPSNNNAKLMQEALEIVLVRLFEKQEITKLYLHCLEHEAELKVILAKLLFKKEGQLREHFFWNGKYHDVEIFALSKEDYYR